MGTKCKKCGAPITGFWAKIAAIAGVKQSLKDPEMCNKCDSETATPVATPVAPVEQPKDLFEAEVKLEAPKVEEPKQE
ncbi:hypothetical protein A2482_02930 [Candidatus Falkowbacteria bacterium RIFOXYC2_FULL_48_21]|uniref:Uncharacterized protein n=1 Tax=Candidatus Falkowbacteria bacterium RIFOXYC2_FULL_48_21 TaxID=1798005 RepID=A0A1F5TDD8_9BACT|nr:MAG: hypothetical protein A2482_02930 [Candidatus Falkowbacteria bacterium RIFOXYC2_FULL_48_21]